VARALYAFHERSIPFLLELLSAPNADLRFYALLLIADIRVEALVNDLVPLLSDGDPQVKDLARTLLLRLRNLPGFRPVLEDLRGAVALDQVAAETRVDALNILATLRDAASADVLVMALSATDHRVASAAHEALRTITGQDHGLAARKWQSWFAEHGKRDRIEWLIDGLMHSDEAVRTLAGNELQRATQQYFGFHPGSAKKERERVQKKYLEWLKTRQA
jgi:HEAT repeat protein